ncbi:hypothetical protein AVEN_217784-1 [Araneus ventricosus]|uniref:Uncharacterized protein n=1 Tax=Araneus ventricosus TaxID=182803 RepID=A0A4Y2EDP1_ARAVE|nr:hypothetical protein AVEN_217784-1 [Araneus ventricosus]
MVGGSLEKIEECIVVHFFPFSSCVECVGFIFKSDSDVNQYLIFKLNDDVRPHVSALDLSVFGDDSHFWGDGFNNSSDERIVSESHYIQSAFAMTKYMWQGLTVGVPITASLVLYSFPRFVTIKWNLSEAGLEHESPICESRVCAVRVEV